ncbi:MAG: type II toxin-antitoxin system VapC family toxin [Cyanobacteria bacterium J06642_3]
MNGNSFIVLDTNVVLYHLGNRLKQPLTRRRYAISIITEIELLSYPRIELPEIIKIQNFIDKTTVVELRNSVKTETIKLRKQYSLKIPDAIIAATALRLNGTLLTKDKKLLGVSEIDAQDVEIKI